MYGDREMLIELKNCQKQNYEEIPNIKSLTTGPKRPQTVPTYNYMSRRDIQGGKSMAICCR